MREDYKGTGNGKQGTGKGAPEGAEKRYKRTGNGKQGTGKNAVGANGPRDGEHRPGREKAGDKPSGRRRVPEGVRPVGPRREGEGFRPRGPRREDEAVHAEESTRKAAFRSGEPRREGEAEKRVENRADRPRHEGERKRAPKGPVSAVSARDVAFKALQDVVRGDAYASQALDRQLEGARLKPEDRRLAASLFYFAVENRLYIERVLDQFVEQKPDPVVIDILHIASAQLLFMDKVPDHAAVDEAVKQVRAQKREGMTGLVNAVLHGMIRARDAGELRLPDRETESAEYLSVRYSIAPPIVKRLIDAYGFGEAERIAAFAPEKRFQTIRPNVSRIDADAFEAWLDTRGFKWTRGVVPEAYRVENAGSLAALDGYRKGFFSIQGESAMLAAQAVEARPGMQIIDACAAPGGKTCLMAERMNGAGRVYAWDIHGHRVELIRAAANRLGLDNVRPAMRDARIPVESMFLAMDAVLVDAPCSGLGVIADKPDIKYRQSEESLSALPAVQARILDVCSEYVKVGGLLVYATCTILPEENENQVRGFLERHPEFEPDCADGWLPEALRSEFHDGQIQLMAHRDGLEGFFIARLRRKGVNRG